MTREEVMTMLDKQLDDAWKKFRNCIKDVIDRAYAEGKRNAGLTVDEVTKLIQDAMDKHPTYPTYPTYPSYPWNDPIQPLQPPYVFTSKDKITLEPSTTTATTASVTSNPSSTTTAYNRDNPKTETISEWL